MTATDPVHVARQWLDGLTAAIADENPSALRALLDEPAHWRDIVALTWDFRRRSGDEVPAAFIAAAKEAGLRNLRLSERFPAPRTARRSARDVIEVIFDFDTNVGPGVGVGVARLVPAGERWVAWVIFTALYSLPDDALGLHRPDPEQVHRDPRDNWLQRRQREVRHEHEPEVVIVGAGHSGLGLGARLKQLGVDALIVEQHPRIGDNWRTRYDSLTLHTPSASSHLPYLPFPETFPMFIPKDKLADWLEFYAWAMELNVWTGTVVHSARYDEQAGRWTVSVSRSDGSTVELHPPHLVLATGGGFGSIPYIPTIPGLDQFAGKVVHTKHFGSGAAYAGKRAMVIGVGTSGHDIAYDLHCHGAEVTMLQRGSVTVVSPHMANLTVAHYFEGMPLDEADLISASGFITPVLVPALQQLTKHAIEYDRAIIEGVERRGLRTDQAEDGTGWLMKSLRTGGGYYINVGASEAIAAGHIAILDAARLVRFEADGAVLDDGTRLPLDLVVLATGYREPAEDLRPIVGDEIANRVGEVFRFDEEGEHRNMWRPTPQRGLWITGVGLGQARNYSRYLALQIAAAVRGLHPAYSGR